MLIATIALAASLQAQQLAEGSTADVTVMNARLGGACTADFLVKDAAGKPVYGANVHVRVRYGFMGAKRADLEVGTSTAGKARLEGLPNKARPLEYDIKKGDQKAGVAQNVAIDCHATYDVTLK